MKQGPAVESPVGECRPVQHSSFQRVPLAVSERCVIMLEHCSQST